MSIATEVNVRSYCTQYQCTFKWMIDNLSKLPDGWREKSSPFIVEPNSEWNVELEIGDIFFLFLHWNNENRFSNTIQIIISNSNKEVLFRDECSYTNSDTDVLRDFSSSICSIKEELPNDQIIVTIAIKVWFSQSDTQSAWITPEIQQGHSRNLRSDFRHIFAGKIKPDLTLHTEGGTLRAHKAILMARSEVFAGMFQAGLKEEETNEVTIEDINMAAMKVLLRFIYSAEVEDLDLGTALEVYVAADKYAVLDLKNYSSRMIASKVTTETATDVLIFAKTHDDSILVDDVMQYIALHYQSKRQPSKTNPHIDVGTRS